MDLKDILSKETNLPVGENKFIKPPKLPYILFLQEKNIRGVADNNLIIDSDVSIELYESIPSKELENKVRNIIINDILKVSNNDDEIEINQDSEYIEKEQLWLTSFDFNLIEKGGN